MAFCTLARNCSTDLIVPKPGFALAQQLSSVHTIIRTKYNGLYIELKRLRGSTVSAAQKQWIARLRDAGYAVEVCKGWEAAAAVITDYLEGRYKPQYQP